MKPILIMMLMAVLHPAAYTQTVYVNKSATGANNGSSWANAFTTLAAAIDAANNLNTIQLIRVAGGIYEEESLTIARGYTIRGSFDPATDKQDLKGQPTIIEPHNHTNPLLYTATTITSYVVSIDGIRWRNAKSVGIYNRATLFLFNCFFSDNENQFATGVFNEAKVNMWNCAFTNPPHTTGALVFAALTTTDPVPQPVTNITNCTFLSHAPVPSIFNAVGTMKISNSIVWGPDNVVQNGSNLILNNNIMAGIIQQGILDYINGAAIDARRIDPRFTDSAAGNLMPLPGSPALNIANRDVYNEADENTGNLSFLVDVDLNGNKRYSDDGIDLGAYERPFLRQTLAGAANISATYGDLPQVPAVTASSNLPIQFISSDENIAAGFTDTDNQQKIRFIKPGTVTIMATQPGNETYDPAEPVTFTVWITRKAITVNATGQTKTYGDADPYLSFTVAPDLVAGDTFTGSLGRDAGENTGTYAITRGDLNNDNYDISYQPALFTIQPKDITVTAANSSKIYNTPEPALSYTVAPTLLNNDQLAGNIVRATGEDAGEYAITQGSLHNSNYSINFVPAIFTIHKAPQQITWNQQLSPACDNNDVITLTATSSSGLPVEYLSGNTNTATIHNNQLSITGPGTVTITATQPGNHNYLPAPEVTNTLTARLPNYLLVKHWNDVLMFDNSSLAYSSWQWYKNGSPVNGATNQYYHESGNLNGTYHATVKNPAGETLITCPINITPGNTTAPVTLFPNPAAPGQTVTVKANYSPAQLQGARIVITNLTGTLVTTQPNVTAQTTLPLSLLPGLYVVRLTLSTGVTHAVNLLVK